MPGYDRSGPMGNGPMTGGGRGYCNSVNAGYGQTSAPIGFGRGMAYGRGFRGGFGANGRGGPGRGFARYSPAEFVQNPADELSQLKQQADSVKNTLESINKRIAELEKGD